MLLAVPDALVNGGGPEGDVFPGVACTGPGMSTSCDNHYFNNKVGQVPPGFEFPAALDQFGVPHSDATAQTMPNGTDFWWDEWASNTGNCWFSNTGPDGTAASVTGPGPAGRVPATPPDFLPDCNGGADPSMSVGLGDATKIQYALDCSNGPDTDESPLACDWWFAPAKPGSRAAILKAQAQARAAAAFETTDEAQALMRRAAELTAGG